MPVTHSRTLALAQVSLLDRRRFQVALLMKLPLLTSATAMLYRVVNQDWARDVIIREVNSGGLALMYELILDSSQREICHVMDVILEATERREAVLFFCKAGKDRTGLVAALVLACVGASYDALIADYVRSDQYHMVALAGLEKHPDLKNLDRSKFERAPAEAMQHALKHLSAEYGGVLQYLEHIGFGIPKQERLRNALLLPPEQSRM